MMLILGRQVVGITKMSKRLRRAYLKKHRSTGVPKGSLHEYHMRAKSAETDFTRTFSICQDPKWNAAPWQETRDRIQELKDSVPTERSIMIGNGRFAQTRLFFNEDHTIWYFLQKKGDIIRKSMTFGSKEIALERWLNAKIIWTDIVPLAQFPASPE